MDLSERPARASARHPWEKARFRFFDDVLKLTRVPSHACRVLDAGAGDGWFSSQLLRSLGPTARITCWDAEYSDGVISELRSTSPDRIEFRRDRPDTNFDIVLLLDVLEHVEDDRSFLRTIVEKNVASDGVILISVPAWQLLYSSHDTRLRHFRRYSPEACRSVIREAGLHIVRNGGLFHSLLVPRAARVAMERIFGAQTDTPPSLDWSAGPLLTRAVDTALQVDNFISHQLASQEIDVPGMSFWAVCKRA